MPNNLFNSEDRIIKFEKSDSSFHLYRYVLHEELNQTTKHMTNHFQRFFVNKQRIEKTRENRHSWNSILNELRLKIKREAEKGVILQKELRIINDHRRIKSPFSEDFTSSTQIDRYLYNNWGDESQSLYVTMMNDIYRSNNNLSLIHI